jgi:hypothetical protein
MSVAYLPSEEDNDVACGRLFEGRYVPVIERQNIQMAFMNSTLTIFTSWSEIQLTKYSSSCLPSARFQEQFPRINFRQFDPDQLLHKYNFTSQQITWMKDWSNMTKISSYADNSADLKRLRDAMKSHVPARLADVWRILLAREYGMAYLDLDMFPISNYSQIYLGTPNVAVPIWSEETGALEIQNSGFCFTASQSDILIQKVKKLMNSYGEKQQYSMYTLFGKSKQSERAKKNNMI